MPPQAASESALGNPRGPPQPTERSAPAGSRSGGSSRARAKAGAECGGTPASGRRGALAPAPRPLPSELTQMTERELGPSPPTQSRCRHPCAKFPRNDTSTAAILPRVGRRLLTLAPTRRASAPREEFCARTEAGVSRFRAAAALRPLAGALDWLQAGEPALSRSRGRCLKGRPSVRLPSRSPPPPPPRLPPPPPIPGASPPSRLGRPPPPRAAVETALRGRRDPHGKMAAADPGGRAELPRGSAAGRGGAGRGRGGGRAGGRGRARRERPEGAGAGVGSGLGALRGRRSEQVAEPGPCGFALSTAPFLLARAES